MIIFRSTENINIKTTDGTLIKYSGTKKPSGMVSKDIYVTTLDDFNDLKNVFSSVGKNYKAKSIGESKFRNIQVFPKELGISNINEREALYNLNFKYKVESLRVFNRDKNFLYLDEKKVDLDKQLEFCVKDNITIIILGTPGYSISEMICACSAFRIFYKKLKTKFKSVKLDLYLNASENKNFSRDKAIFSNQTFFNKVEPLSIDMKKFCEYDFFVDAGSVNKKSFYNELPFIDVWLHKLGIDYKSIPNMEKYNSIDLKNYKPNKELKNKLDILKAKGDILLFHPFSANIKKSIPKEIAVSLLKQMIVKLPNYTIVSTLKIDSKIDEDRYVDLSKFSKTFLDFSYIISNMSKIITVNTSTYHVAEAFFIPTIVIFTPNGENKVYHNYQNSKAIYIEDKSKNLSKFVFENNALIFNRFLGWKNLKVSKIIKLLESF